MKLKVILPTEIMVDEEVTKVTAEAGNGSFCLLPRHIDFVAALAPGLLSFVKADDGSEEFLAVDEGILVKCGPEVLVSTPKAVRGPELGQLRETVDRTFKVLTDQERKARSALANLEANFIRRFLKLEEHG
ncbi:MAG: F0F1 ATP synthase subunit epsilon [Syntrophales bacterium]|nr:F0F1 ATP synthase subunit epsilon [Syntrophales bacterium]MDD5642903.1 F0F1 ATP synthase subunit epsilon [Syntrophales bacterium]